jgi:hypothetical protein
MQESLILYFQYVKHIWTLKALPRAEIYRAKRAHRSFDAVPNISQSVADLRKCLSFIYPKIFDPLG